MSIDLYATFKKYFGYEKFRPLQHEIIEDVLQKKDVFALMPTGGGKSLCYQLPALLQSGLTIVVSPLIALMKDQVDTLRQNGIAAAFFNSTLSLQEKNEIQKLLNEQKLRLLYVAPERLMKEDFLSMLQNLNISLFAIDEAHCISEWGHDFRPEYRQLSKLKLLFPKVPIIALTATATPRVKIDIVKQLNLNSPKKYQASFNRQNLVYQVKEKYEKLEQILQFSKNHKSESGIIYCHSRDNVERLTSQLQKQGLKVVPYHGGLDDKQRDENQEKFLKEDVDVCVATVAFGMGIDKSNVRFIVHADLPSNLERYYQETGRAGRDGLPSECLLLFSLGDKEKIIHFINQKPNLSEQQIARVQLKQMVQFAQSNRCRRVELLLYFGEQFENENCKACDNCLTPKETFDATEISQKILSCIYRVGQRFGTKYIAEVLTGKSTKQVIQNHHNILSTFGIIKDHSIKEIQTYTQELINLNLLNQTVGKYPVLNLTSKSWEILKHKSQVTLTKLQAIAKLTNTTDKFVPTDEVLFNRLRSIRKTLADKQGVPPYIIFSDASLREMSSLFPQTKEQFAQIKGVGEQKLIQYADIFLKEIIFYCRQNNLQYQKSYQPTKTKTKHSSQGSTIKQTIRLFMQGFSLDEIAKKRGFVKNTIINHLEQAYLQGEPIDIDSLVPKEKQANIINAFEKLGTNFLAPVKAKLGENYSYEELRLIRAKLTRSNQ